LTLGKNGGTVYGQGEIMPAIRPSADLENNYNEISELCHEYSEPVFITKDGVGDLAVMSIETYELLLGRLELYSRIHEGLEQAGSGKTKPMKKSIKTIRSKIR
jgi:PHD/YefM family antitoxin component YafN of YafNO toxin-antitoxin module